MFWELLRFELYYRRRRATTYVYFFVIFLTSFITITSPTLSVTGTADSTSANAPYTIAVLMVVLSFFFSLITSSLVGVAVIRDEEHEMSPIIFTTPIDKGSYLFGRFGGSLIILILLNTGIIFGALTAYLVGRMLPSQWEVAWHAKEILPFDFWAYLQPFIIFTVSNIFITGALFFAAGALVRKSVVIYSQGIALLMLYQVANIFYLRDLDSQRIAAILDPFAVQTFIYMTRYWTPVEQNTLLVPFQDVMLYNRIIWISIAIVVLIITYWRFSFTTRRGWIRAKTKTVDTADVQLAAGPLPDVVKAKGRRLQWAQLFSGTWFHFRGIWREVPFIAIAATGLLVLFVNSARMNAVYGTSSYPTTGAVLTMLGSFSLFFSIILIFYSGEIIWKERQFRFDSVIDAAPVSNHVIVFSKYLTLCMVYLTFLGGFFVYGILLQAAQGYYQFDLKAYFGTLSETFINLALITVVAMLIQSIAGNKFLGFVCTVMFVLLVTLLPLFGIEHEMVAYASGTLGAFSQMNGFGHFVIPFAWLKTYWLALAIALFIPAVVLYRRGTEKKLLVQWKSGTRQLPGSLKKLGIVALVAFVGIGAYIYYNTSVLNHFEGVRFAKAIQFRNEHELKRFETTTQPDIVDVNINVDIYPNQRSFKAKGSYYLKNYDSLPVKSIQLQHMISRDLDLHDVTFGRTAGVSEDRPDLGYRSYTIDPPLTPGDSLRMEFTVDFTQKGFKSKSQNTDLVYNGTFFRSNYFPKVGFRKEPRLIRFKATVSTDSAQYALAPGRLIKDWYDNNRHYQQYEASDRIPDTYAILSGKYLVDKDKWNDVDLEIYFHPAHKFNVARMMQGLKDGLNYYSKNFGAAPTSTIRIVEFPKYSTNAQSFPGIIAFSEGVGFVLKVSDPAKNLDVPYYATAHELAHQWWGQQVIAADAPGKEMLSEGLAQYSALMVMDQSYPAETMQLFLKYELDAYLKGRTNEKKKEMPLISVGDQQYISYNKSALAFFALRDYIGEDNLNHALHQFYEQWKSKTTPYPTSKDLVDDIRKVTPDSVSYLIGDLFERITLFENKAAEGAYSVLPNNTFETTLTLSTQKFQVDSTGVEKPVQINDWIDIGIYGEGEGGRPKLIYLKKYKFTRQKNTITISLKERPVKAGIDPLHKLIDYQPTDNIIDIGTVIELSN